MRVYIHVEIKQTVNMSFKKKCIEEGKLHGEQGKLQETVNVI